MTALRNAMSVDVEEYFQVSAFEQAINPVNWDKFSFRVEGNIDRILELFDRKGVQATFFTLGWIAERHPEMVRRIVDEGHELASHGWRHIRVHKQNSDSFYKDVMRTKTYLEDLSGKQVKGYRAASYSINASNEWAWDVLTDAGYLYSSSIVPINHDLYGMPGAPRFSFVPSGRQILEVPISTIGVAGKQLNCGGGGWFRLFPYSFSRWAINRINTQEREPAIFYFHPWEIDPEQPRPEGLSFKTRFRHYINLDRTFDRLEKLLSDFEWGRMDDIFLVEGQ